MSIDYEYDDGPPYGGPQDTPRKCYRCDGHGYYYTRFVGPIGFPVGEGTPIASSVRSCNCGVNVPQWVYKATFGRRGGGGDEEITKGCKNK